MIFPLSFKIMLSYWNWLLYKGLMRTNNSLIIPNREAYVFVTNYAKNGHPNFIGNPHSLVKTTPYQVKGKRIDDFYLSFRINFK